MKKLLVLFMTVLLSNNAHALASKVTVHTLKVEKMYDKTQLKKIQEEEVEIENPLNKEITVQLKLLHPQYNKEQHTAISLEDYILGKDKVYTLKPLEKKKVKIGLKLPEDMKGTLYVYYSFDVVKEELKPTSLVMELLTYGQMTIGVKDTFVRTAEVKTEVQKGKDEVVIKAHMVNTGNTYIRRIESYCLIQDIKTKKLIGKFPMAAKEASYLFQTNDRTYSTIIKKKLKGKYKMTVVFSNNDGNFNKVIQDEIEL